MYRFSKVSLDRLATVDQRLQSILNEAIKERDFMIICGHRDQEAQEQAFRSGASDKHWPYSKHNSYPSIAVDIAPYPLDWKDALSFARLVGYIERIAWEKHTIIRWGADWNDNFSTKDHKLVDCPHIELV